MLFTYSNHTRGKYFIEFLEFFSFSNDLVKKKKKNSEEPNCKEKKPCVLLRWNWNPQTWKPVLDLRLAPKTPRH